MKRGMEDGTPVGATGDGGRRTAARADSRRPIRATVADDDAGFPASGDGQARLMRRVAAVVLVALAAAALLRGGEARADMVTRRASATSASVAVASAEVAAADAPRPVLTVCAEPDNLPYSNARGEGFENRVAELLAADLGMRVSHVWAVQRRGYLRRGLNAGRCDLVMSAPVGLQGLVTSRPWYSSSYVFVTRRDGPRAPASYDDPSWRHLTIGLQAIGAEGGNTPPAMSLARRGLTAHVRGYPMWGREGEVDPQGRIVDAVASGEVDVAIVWGPFAGWFAKRHGDRLVITPVDVDPLEPGQRPDFEMALGLRRGDEDRLRRLQAALDRHRLEIDRLLRDYGMPTAAGRPSDEAADFSPEKSSSDGLRESRAADPSSDCARTPVCASSGEATTRPSAVPGIAPASLSSHERQ